MIESPTVRRALLAVLVLLIVVALATVALVVATRSAGDGLGERLDSLRNDDVPGSSVADTRERLLSVSREFATRFNTYDPSMLDDDGHLPEYASITELLTPKFGGVFDEALRIPEQTVAQGASSVAQVFAVGVASQDEDSAVVLVAGTVELSYPLPDEAPQGGDDGSDEEDRLTTGPQRFRYEVSLVRIEGQWLVDDLDDVDDGRPSFSEPAIPEESPGTTPSVPPTTAPSGPTSEGTESTQSTEPTEGEQ